MINLHMKPHLHKFLSFIMVVLFCLLYTSIIVMGCNGKPINTSISEEDREETAIVTKVIDGDTIQVKFPEGNTETVRYIGIDAPEEGEYYAEQAAARNKELIAGKRVRLEKEVSERDEYERLLRHVYIGFLMINAALLYEGCAEAAERSPDLKHSGFFKKIETHASERSVGMWGESEDEDEATVIEIIDGDTVKVQYSNGDTDLIGYLCIRAPKGQEFFSQEAETHNETLVLGRKVRLEKDISERDADGRLLRYVYINGLLVNADLVANGCAFFAASSTDISYTGHLTELEEQAREARIGIWGNPIVYITRTGEKYHLDGCQHLSKSKISVTLEEAKARGYEP